MARLPRLDLPGVSQHVIQRGNNRLPCFFGETDYRCYLTQLREASRHWGCSVHAYVLMTNHVHLLVTPAEAGSLSRMMQALGRRYVGYINASYRRTGTLWEGRYKACLVDSQAYLLTCYRYIELNPVRAAMVEEPSGYMWSSYHGNALGREDACLTPHAEYLSLGADQVERLVAYQRLFATALSDDRLAEIRAYVKQQRALGTEKFQAEIEAALARCARVRPAHRPVSKCLLGTGTGDK